MSTNSSFLSKTHGNHNSWFLVDRYAINLPEFLYDSGTTFLQTVQLKLRVGICLSKQMNNLSFRACKQSTWWKSISSPLVISELKKIIVIFKTFSFNSNYLTTRPCKSEVISRGKTIQRKASLKQSSWISVNWLRFSHAQLSLSWRKQQTKSPMNDLNITHSLS